MRGSGVPRHLYYVGGEVGGVLGLVDASEMPDTYACKRILVFNCVVGFALPH